MGNGEMTMDNLKKEELYSNDWGMQAGQPTCLNPLLKNSINILIKKYGQVLSKDEIVSECMYAHYTTLHGFILKDGATWADILNNKDQSSINKLYKAITKAMNKKVYEIANPTQNVYIEGEQLRIKKTHSSYESIDSTEKNIRVENLLTTSAWQQYDDYIPTDFLEWFRDNKQDFLTANQLQFLMDMEGAQHLKDGYTTNDVEAVTGKKKQNIKRYYKTIQERTLRAYEKHLKEKESNKLKQSFDELETREDAEDWLIGQKNNELIINLLYDNLTGHDDSHQLTLLLKGAGGHKNSITYKCINILDSLLINPTYY